MTLDIIVDKEAFGKARMFEKLRGQKKTYQVRLVDNYAEIWEQVSRRSYRLRGIYKKISLANVKPYENRNTKS